jgi:hypothetical protein
MSPANIETSTRAGLSFITQCARKSSIQINPEKNTCLGAEWFQTALLSKLISTLLTSTHTKWKNTKNNCLPFYFILHQLLYIASY